MAAAEEARGLFVEGVRAVLGGWAALQLAVAQEFGGPQSPEKASWLVGALTEFFAQNEDLREEEVEEFLAEVMDNEFDTAVEDGSLRQVSRELVTLFSRASRGDLGGLGEALGALGARRGPALRAAMEAGSPAHPAGSPAHHTGSPAHPAGSPTPHTGSGPHSDQAPSGEEEEEQEMELEAPPPPDSWTLVRRRRR